MKKFSSFDVKPVTKIFIGDKMKISKVLNREIIVHDYKIEDSKCFKDRGDGKCLHLQISMDSNKHIVFTSSGGLMEIIQQIPKDDFPFETTIIEEDKRFLFT
jgi:hypothetical protein